MPLSGFNWVLIMRAFCLHRLIAKPKLRLQCFPATVHAFDNSKMLEFLLVVIVYIMRGHGFSPEQSRSYQFGRNLF